jgi:hypothetical protein
MSSDPLRRVPTEDVHTSEEVAALCRAHPGRWAEVDVVVPAEGEQELREIISEARDPAFAPAGSFQMTLSHPARKLRVMYRKPKKTDLSEALKADPRYGADIISSGSISSTTINTGKLYGKNADAAKRAARSEQDDARVLKIVNGELRPDADDLHMMTSDERRLWESSKRARTLAKWGLGTANEYGERELIKEEKPKRSNHSGAYDRYGNYRGVVAPPSEYVPGDTSPREDVGDRYYAQSGKAHFEEIDTIARWLREEDR